jgi:phage gpG-like protein
MNPETQRRHERRQPSPGAAATASTRRAVLNPTARRHDGAQSNPGFRPAGIRIADSRLNPAHKEHCFMAHVSITIDERRVRIQLRTLYEMLTDLSPVLRQLGEIVHTRAMESFDQGKAPEGGPWPPSARVRQFGGKTLIDTSTLRNSINVQASATEVRIGTPVIYGPVHQFGSQGVQPGRTAAMVSKKVAGGKTGTGKTSHARRVSPGGIPARPFLGLKLKDWGELRQLVGTYLVQH